MTVSFEGIKSGDVILYEGEMVILRDYAMYTVTIETEEGERKTVVRNEKITLL